MNEWTKSRFEVAVTSYGRNKNHDDEIKNIAEEFSLTKQKTRPRTDYEWIGKTVEKKNLIQKIEKKQ